MSEDDKLSKAAKLALTGAIAPILRSASVTTQKRRIAKVDKDGNVTGYTTLAEVQEALVADKALEIQVDEGVRPQEIICELCGKLVEVGPHGVVPSICSSEDGGCHRQLFCACGCGKAAPKHVFQLSRVVEREGKPWRCTPSARRIVLAALTPEQRSSTVRKGHAKKNAEQRSATAREWHAKLTPEQRSDVLRKAWETRRAKAAQKATAAE